jgi:two-component system nitrate/nitrite response regulator NarL
MGGRRRGGDTGRVPLTVLVVDDDAGFRRVVRRLLLRRGFVVVAEVGDGAAALAAVRRHRPDGVLLDVGLPDRDGLAVTRAVADRPHPPAVVLTSTDACGFPAAVLAACGARAFVAKDRLVGADLRRLFSPAGT